MKFQLKTSKLLTTKGLEISFNVAFRRNYLSHKFYTLIFKKIIA